MPARRFLTYKMQYCFAAHAVALTLVFLPTIAQGQTVPDAGFVVSNYTGNAPTEAPPASPPPPPGRAHVFASIPRVVNLACNLNVPVVVAEAFAPGTLPPPSEDVANPANSSTSSAPDASNTTIFVAPAVGLNGLLGNGSANLNTTIVQQLTFSGDEHCMH